jgi:hypothetical protein
MLFFERGKSGSRGFPPQVYMNNHNTPTRFILRVMMFFDLLVVIHKQTSSFVDYWCGG